MGVSVNEKSGPVRPGMVLNQFVVICPTTLYDARVIADHIQECRSVLVNTEAIDDALKRRILDFAAGFVYTLEGSYNQIADNLYLIVPCGVDIDDTYQDL